MALAGAFALALSLGLAGSAAAEDASVSRVGQIVIKELAQDPESVVDYWTKERMREARPADFAPFALDQAFSEGGGEIAPSSSYEPRGEPVAIPGSPGSSYSSDSSYSVGSDIEANPVGGSNNTLFPLNIHGRIFATNPANGANLSCSGTVITAPLGNLVITAGHCVFGAGAGNQYFTNYVFVPGYFYGQRPFGTYPAGALYTLSGWVAGAGFSHDVGIAALTTSIQPLLGARGIAFNQPTSQVWDHFGYPARPNPSSDGFGDYDGERLILCDNAITQGLEASGTPPSVGSAYCFMQQGASGGGWVIDGTGNVNSVVSHGYCQNRPGFPGNPNPHVWPNGPCGIFFGPYFGTNVQALYNQAAAVPTADDEKKCKNKKKDKKKNNSASASKKKKKKKCKGKKKKDKK